MICFQILFFVSIVAATPWSYYTRLGAPQSYFYYPRIGYYAAAPQGHAPLIDVDSYVAEVQKENYLTDNRVNVDISSKSPSSVAALAYVNSVGKEGLCGKAAEARVKSILNGESKEAAAGEAARACITAFNSGERYEIGGACWAAERAWKDASASEGKDHVLEATLAVIKMRMVILELLLGLTMLKRYYLVNHAMNLLLLQ